MLFMCVFAFAARPASASLLVANNDTIAESGVFRWEYALGIEFDQEIRAGAAFTVYDFAGFNPLAPGDVASTTPVGSGVTAFPSTQSWVFSFDLFGGTPGDALLDDDPAIYNLTWTYTGTDTLRGDDEGEQAVVGYFSAQSPYEDLTVDWYAGQAYNRTPESGPPPPGLVFNSEAALLVPAAPEGPAPVPEPASMFLVGTGLLAAFRISQRRLT
jgi:hypothetical protein